MHQKFGRDRMSGFRVMPPDTWTSSHSKKLMYVHWLSSAVSGHHWTYIRYTNTFHELHWQYKPTNYNVHCESKKTRHSIRFHNFDCLKSLTRAHSGVCINESSILNRFQDISTDAIKLAQKSLSTYQQYESSTAVSILLPNWLKTTIVPPCKMRFIQMCTER